MDISTSSYFGKYLSELRLSRGYTNTNEYLRRYPVQMSNVHYRHLESGNRKISIETAKDLCEALQADAKIFYFNLLKDSLPEEFMDFFVPLSRDKDSVDLSRECMKVQYQTAVMRALDSQVLFPSSEACEYLEKHFELMPVIWCVYSTAHAGQEDIEQIIQKNEISVSSKAAIDELSRLGLVNIKKHAGRLVAVRVKPSICFSHHALGLRILQHETKQSLSQYVHPRNPQLKDSILILSVMSVSPKARKRIFRRIQDLSSELREAADVSFSCESETSEPVFYSIVFAPRKQYAAKPVPDRV